MNPTRGGAFGLLASFCCMAALPASAQATRPNILVTMGDDIGCRTIRSYNRGMMEFRTPTIGGIANEGALFADYYGQRSCIAGRAAFITGQSPTRTGLLKPQGYVTAQFDKDHLGDRNELLPAVHGFDEFRGNIYRLNAEDESGHPATDRTTANGEQRI